MKIESTKVDNAVILKISGRMDAESNKEFDAACERWMQDGALHLVVDLADLQYINSAGLGSILRNAKRMQEKGGSLLLCGLKGLVKEVFELTRLITVFQVFESTEAACQSI